MKPTIIYLIGFVCFLSSCRNADQKEGTTVQPMSANDTNIIKKSKDGMNAEDKNTFMTNAAIGGLMEVEASNLLLSKSKDQEVIAHAKMIKNDHDKANVRLKQIADELQFKLPKLLPESKQKLLKQMISLNNEAMNEYYINLMVTEHQEAIDLFRMGSTIENAKLASFATELLPTLEHHYQMTVKMQSPKSKVNQGDDVLKISDKTKAEPAKNHN